MELKIICSNCNKPFTINEEDKEEWDCPHGCGGHAVGIGVCNPNNFDDEFSTKKREKVPYMN